MYFTENIVNSTNVLELRYLIDVYVSSYLTLDAMQLAYLFCLYLYRLTCPFCGTQVRSGV